MRVIRIGRYTVEKTAIDAIPDAMARVYGVMPLSVVNDTLHCVAGSPDTERLRRTLHDLAKLLRLNIRYRLADQRLVAALIEETYTNLHDEIEDCEFSFRCPKRWLELNPTADARVRHCDECDRDVYWSADEREAKAHARRGRCVALHRPPTEVLDVLGMLRLPGEADD